MMTERPEDTTQDKMANRFSEEKQGLDDIGRRLNKARAEHDKPSGLAMKMKAPPSNVLGLAFRVSVEVVSALAVGFGIGWLLDQWLDTRPWFMLVFLLLGSIAGMLNVYRVASGFGMAAGYDTTDSEDGEDDKDAKEDENKD